MKTRWRFLKTLNTELSYVPPIALLGIPHRHRVMKRRGTCIPMFIAAMSIIAKLWKEPRCPSAEEWTKMWFIYTMEYYSVSMG